MDKSQADAVARVEASRRRAGRWAAYRVEFAEAWRALAREIPALVGFLGVGALLVPAEFRQAAWATLLGLALVVCLSGRDVRAYAADGFASGFGIAVIAVILVMGFAQVDLVLHAPDWFAAPVIDAVGWIFGR
jgi:hypothetical protein